MLGRLLRKGLRKNSKEKLMDSSDKYKDHLYALILAGGGGTRLWPKSRNKTPKQFLKLFGKETLMQITAKRLNEMIPWERMYCVTVSNAYKKEILKEVPKFIPGNIIVEPARRDTAPAHGIGAAYIYKKDPDAVIITESADRLVKPLNRYLKILSTAAMISYESKKPVAMGVEARYPNTGYGHIKRGKKWGSYRKDVDFYILDKFVEKPPIEIAKKYTSSGNYYWNAGQYVWRADSLLEEFATHAHKIHKALVAIMDSIGTKNEEKVVEKEYKSMPKIGIDYAISEKSKDFLVVEGDFFWTDIGDWREVWANSKKDQNSNVIVDGGEKGGEVINIDTSDALIHTDGRLIAVVDVDNLIVVDTKDALLVTSKSKAQSVKKIVNKLKEEKRNELL